jgi:hypothetical protein
MYKRNIEKLYKNYNCDGYVMLSKESGASKVYFEWLNGPHREQKDSDNMTEELKVHWGKLDGYTPRIALNLHTMSEARNKKVNRTMMKQSMENAIKLIENFFKPHIKRAYHYRGLNKEDKMKNKMYDWLLKKAKGKENPVFDRTEINQNWRPNSGKTVPVNIIKEYCTTLESEGKGINLANKYFYVFYEE